MQVTADGDWGVATLNEVSGELLQALTERVTLKTFQCVGLMDVVFDHGCPPF